MLEIVPLAYAIYLVATKIPPLQQGCNQNLSTINQISSIARSAAKMIKRVRHATNDIKREILESSEDKEFTEIKKTIKEGSEAYKEVTNTIKRGTKL